MFLKRGFILLLSFSIFACSSASKVDTKSAEAAFQQGEKYEADERYEEAITSFSEVKNKYPYSRFAVEAELKIGDIEFKRENYAEAETAYKLFKEFHPSHVKIPYVTNQLGLSVFKQLPETIDRDLSLAVTAIGYFDQVITSYPDSEYVKSAKEYKQKAQQMLADKEHYIAEFYFIREHWQSALGRYEDLMQNHPGFGYDSAALYGATISAYKMKDMDKAKQYFKRLLAEYPNSKELKKARQELADGF